MAGTWRDIAWLTAGARLASTVSRKREASRVASPEALRLTGVNFAARRLAALGGAPEAPEAPASSTAGSSEPAAAAFPSPPYAETASSTGTAISTNTYVRLRPFPVCRNENFVEPRTACEGNVMASGSTGSAVSRTPPHLCKD